MDIITILRTIFSYSLLALAGIGILIPVYAGAFLLYKKIFHGSRTLSVKQWSALVLLSAWLLLVLGLTTFSRGANFTGTINTSLFSGYVNAWHEWSYTELQLIIFNMLMFAPLGFLLPFLSQKGEKFRFTCLVSFLVTFLIEVLQLITGRGIFELDDLLHNFVGSIFGYFVIMFFLTSFRRKGLEWKSLVKALVLPFIFVIGIGCAIAVYNGQEYGNMPIIPAEKQNMSAISIENEAVFSEGKDSACVYRNPRANDSQYRETIAQAVEALTDIEFKAVRRDGKNHVYVSNSSNIQLTILTNSGEWNYNTWSYDTVELTEAETLAKRNELEEWMKQYNLLPDGMIFSVQDGSILRWDAPTMNGNYPQDDFALGSIMVAYNQSGEISSFHYNVITHEYIENVTLMSEKDAYLDIMDGNFEQYTPFEKEDNLVVKDCRLDYTYDTKGFYRPVYRFSGYINQADYPWEAIVSAME